MRTNWPSVPPALKSHLFGYRAKLGQMRDHARQCSRSAVPLEITEKGEKKMCSPPLHNIIS